MDFLGDVVAWFADSQRWSGPNGIPARTWEHLLLAVLPMLLAVAVALPPALYLAHRRIGEFLANALVNIGRAVPSFGVLLLAAVFFSRGGISLRFWPVVVTLFALAIPPIFTNAYAAVATMSPATVEAARGMGFREGEVLWRIEVPVGLPVILAGVRISFIQVLATVPLAAVISSGGGFGQYVVRGFATRDYAQAFAGAILVAAITLLAEWAFGVAERPLVPRGVRRLRAEDAKARV